MHFLCLHGIGASAEVFKTQLSAISASVGSKHEFVFLEGHIPSDAGPGMDGMGEGPYCSFFDLPVASQLYEAFDLIDQAVEEDGPVAASYLIRNADAQPPFKCAVFFCATAPFDVDSIPYRGMEDGTFRDGATGAGEDVSAEIEAAIPDLQNRTRYPSKGKTMIRPYPADGSIEIRLPTAHIYGANDWYYRQSRNVVQMCQSFDKEELRHNGGHSIPWEQGVTGQIFDLLRKMEHAVELM